MKSLNGLCGRCRCDNATSSTPNSTQRLNGLCGRCRCDSVHSGRLTTTSNVSMASAAGVAATLSMKSRDEVLLVSMASAAGFAATDEAYLDVETLLSEWPLRPVSLRQTNQPFQNAPRGKEVSMASAAGVAATVGRMGVVCEAPVSMASAAGVSGTYRLKPEPRVVWSQWLLQPVTTRNHRGKGNKRTTKKRREKRKRCLNGLCGHSNGTLRNEACRSQRRTCCQRTTRALFMRTVMQPGLRALPFPCAGRRRTSAAS